MRLIINKEMLPWWLLIISLAFNVGFGSTYTIRSYTPGVSATGNPKGIGRGTMSMVLAHEGLNLSSVQEAQIQQINENLLTKINSYRWEIGDARVTLAELLSQPELDQEAVATQLDVISAIQRDAQQLVIDHLLQEREILHPDQIDAFNKIIKNCVCPGDGTGGFGPGWRKGDGPGKGRRDGSGGGQGRGNRGRGG